MKTFQVSALSNSHFVILRTAWSFPPIFIAFDNRTKNSHSERITGEPFLTEFLRAALNARHSMNDLPFIVKKNQFLAFR
jgi:hypothetical protein